MTAREIAQRLANFVEDICRQLLPNGKKQGSEWCSGSIYDEKGDSLRVHLSGEKAGVWKDFACNDKGGDLLDLYSKTQDVGIKESIIWAKDYLGIEDTYFSGSKKTYKKPEKPKCTKPKGGVLNYLLDERKLSQDSIDAYKISEAGDEIVFPYLRDSELVFVKYRNFKDKKKQRTEKDCEPCLFGWQAIPDDAREVLICEGEIDAPSWYMAGIPALSVPTGSQGTTWIENEYDNLDRFDVIYISFDQDEAGKKGAAEVISRLGNDRCRLVSLPLKDANEVIKNMDALALIGCKEKSKSLDPEELKAASYYHNKVIDIFTGKAQELSGYVLPWAKGRDRFRIRMGELTILAGENFHGKSEGVGHILVDCKSQGAKICGASLEYPPQKWIANLAVQASGIDPKESSKDYAEKVVSWTEENLWSFNASGTAKGQKVLEIFLYAHKRYGIDLFVIDNLAKCGFDEDDYNGQKKFIDNLSDFARDFNVHVILVHHLNKSEEGKARTKAAVKGTGAITDMSHNVIIWWRNRNKERELEATKKEDVSDSLLNKPDALMIVEKQKEGGDTPKIGLFFDKKSRQFLEFKNARPKQYVNYSAIAEEA